ncbi:hmg box protein [Diplodia corticola]|uniref:Hmg box protein n=1 Tax=Diplodia corticola TaxID=236234 RepID=A0A1J9R3D3_9PEZI|nr:hmg box protein [Diplodia corticola]OJD35942.1 hmg box protein [Diplodia corticola]
MMDVEMSEPGAGKGEKSASSSRKASTTVSTRSSRRTASPSRSSKQDDAAPPTPESPPFRLTRKRAASLADKGDREEDDVVEDITPTTTHSRMSSGGASVGSVASPANHVCLCQPDPKIPRPRNAFILYRQHHQAAIVAQHPGLANPEISKIIGEQWKSQPEAVRNEWKALAEEEKLRHQQQYPEYRYQPRRGGRRGSLTALNTATDKHLCAKCGGRSITTPTTPFPSHHHGHNAAAATTASASSPSSNVPMLPPPTPSSALTPTSRYLPPMMSSLAINTGASGSSNNTNNTNALPRRTSSTARPSPLTNLHAARANSRDEHPMDMQMLSPLSPDAKRRRLHQTYVPPPSASSTPRSASLSQQQQQQPGTPYPFPSADPRRQSLPRPDMLRGGGGSISSPRHNNNGNNNNSGSTYHLQRDGSNNLTLPPLQTAANSSHHNHHHHHHHPYPAGAAAAASAIAARHAGSSSGGGGPGTPVSSEALLPAAAAVAATRKVGPEATIWSKILILGKIAPPYRGVGTAAAAGAGPSSSSAVSSRSSSLSSPSSSSQQQQQNRGEEKSENKKGKKGKGEKVRGAIVAVEGDDVAAARAMGKWLEESFNKSGEVWARVAEAPRGPDEAVVVGRGAGTGTGGDGEAGDGDVEGAGGNGGGGGGVVVGIGDYIQVIAEWHGKTKEMVEFITSPPSGGTPADGGESNGEAVADRRTPVLIMPTYSLRATDAWASRLHVGDNYARSDHWQWSATLWRGIVGPDITVYVRDVSELDLPVGKPVDVLEQGASKCLMVKRVVGKEIEESALRRLGFEIGELIRSVSQVNGK